MFIDFSATFARIPLNRRLVFPAEARAFNPTNARLSGVEKKAPKYYADENWISVNEVGSLRDLINYYVYRARNWARTKLLGASGEKFFPLHVRRLAAIFQLVFCFSPLHYNQTLSNIKKIYSAN
jgi:hypothetical protein